MSESVKSVKSLINFSRQFVFCCLAKKSGHFYTNRAATVDTTIFAPFKTRWKVEVTAS